jgi:hypothetical protein
MATDPPESKSPDGNYSSRLKELKEQRVAVTSWIEAVKTKISELEEVYLTDSSLGNIIRGWDIDGKSFRLGSQSWDDRESSYMRERLFSCSSYEVWFETKTMADSDVLSRSQYRGEISGSHFNQRNSSTKAHKRTRKSATSNFGRKDDDDPDWDNGEDF